jgi:hypothetical protein
MATPEFSEAEDKLFDKLSETKSAAEARDIVLKRREEALGGRAVSQANRVSTPHYSRRGGRSFPEPSDSELDPYWNGKGDTSFTENAGSRDAFEQLIHESAQATIQTYAKNFGVSIEQAAAILKAQKERKRR